MFNEALSQKLNVTKYHTISDIPLADLPLIEGFLVLYTVCQIHTHFFGMWLSSLDIPLLYTVYIIQMFISFGAHCSDDIMSNIPHVRFHTLCTSNWGYYNSSLQQYTNILLPSRDEQIVYQHYPSIHLSFVFRQAGAIIGDSQLQVCPSLIMNLKLPKMVLCLIK